MKTLLVSLIKLYHKYISVNMLPSCRFHPSCSEYTCSAIQQKGVVKGLGLGLYRIIRCNPFSKGGYDPVK